MSFEAMAIAPATESPLTIFRKQLELGMVAYQFDRKRGAAVFPPRVLGPGSGNDLEWRVSKGRGTVYAVTVISPKGDAPYNVVLVDMDENFRMMSRVEGVPADRVRIGMRVYAGVSRHHESLPPFPTFFVDDVQ
jgi:uncharacterized OB-fold protein